MSQSQVVVIGGGPVGALNACYMAKRGYKVNLFESRNDIRKTENAVGRSINLALSCRGIAALKHVGLDKKAIELGIPMHARMIHLPNGRVYAVPYGNSKQFLLSVDRMKLNKLLLTAASSDLNVSLNFKHKLISCNVDQPSAVFRREDGSEITVNGDLLFGCDGSYSAVRKQLLRGKFDYSQEYIEHGYKELTIPPNKNNQYAMDLEYLHIWPRHEFMLIALPNLDKSFTCTLFMPFSKYQHLTDAAKVIDFFNEVFPDVVPLIGEERLKSDFFSLPPLSLISVKCHPYHYGHTVALFGDAAHAVVPFFGQGLNASLEDVLVFDEVMDKLDGNIKQVLPAYTETRCRDGHAIADLSKQNYIEMRSSVVSLWFLFRKKVDDFITFFFPSVFIPKYTMVSFTRTPYHRVIEISKRQDKIVNSSLVVSGLGLAALFYYLFKNYDLQQVDISSRCSSFCKRVLSVISKPSILI